MKISVGICAYNEANNIGKLLSKLVKYPFEIIVVASGCTDNTVPIAKSFNCRVIEQTKREGKSSAVNLFLQESKGDILILQSADTLPCDFTFKHLILPFEKGEVGMVGAHPIPINLCDSWIEKVGYLLWRTHHYMALQFPKAGEVCAFRNVVKCIDKKSAVDEVSIEHEIVKQGYTVQYSEDALIFNKVPTTVKDFMKQRERIFVGHLKVRDEGYAVKTMNQLAVLMATLKASKNPLLLSYAAFLESKARYNATKDYENSKEYFAWDMVNSTKDLK